VFQCYSISVADSCWEADVCCYHKSVVRPPARQLCRHAVAAHPLVSRGHSVLQCPVCTHRLQPSIGCVHPDVHTAVQCTLRRYARPRGQAA
jgi:hypothetical protein